MSQKPIIVRRYSVAFKQRIVEEIEKGLSSVAESRKKYDILGVSTIQKWIRKFGKNHLLAKIVRIEMTNEPSRISELEKRIRLLEKALSDSQLRIMALESEKEVLSEYMDGSLKKNFDQSRLTGHEKK